MITWNNRKILAEEKNAEKCNVNVTIQTGPSNSSRSKMEEREQNRKEGYSVIQQRQLTTEKRNRVKF